MSWKILVPLDGADASSRALPWASALARDLAATVKLMHVRPLTPPEIRDSIEEALDAAPSVKPSASR